MKKKHQGFTLIELMIVVTVIAILAAIAIPQYHHYILRSQMTRALFELNTIRTSVEVCESDGSTNNCDLLDTIDSDMLIAAPSVSFAPTSITAEFGSRASPALQGGTITLTRSNTGSSWECDMTVSSSVPSYLIPKSCQ